MTTEISANKFKYNWYETNIARFLSKYHLPISYKDDFHQFVLIYKEQFLLDYKNLLLCGELPGLPIEFYKDLENLYPYLEQLFNEIISIIDYWEMGELGKAEFQINSLLKDVNNNFCLATINDKTLFRVRVPKSNEDFSVDPMSLFHIPYHLRYLSRNDRYNMAGRPCLYLSNRLNLAWKECGMPQKFYYAKFENKMCNDSKWQYLYFPSPKEIKNMLVGSIKKDTWEFIIKFFKSYPLIFICSIVNTHSEDPYKPEYIFPQLLMQWVERNFDKIKGIIYFPCVDYDDIRFWNGYNVVLPAKDSDSDGYSVNLKKAFSIKKPIYQDNKLSEKSVDLILKVQKKLSEFMIPQNELGDCVYHMDLIISRAIKLTKRIMSIDSLISLSYIEMLLDDMTDFKYKFPLTAVIQSCKDSQIYQDRYEKSYLTFSEIYSDFLNVIEIVDKHFAYLDRGFEIEKP